MKILLDECIDRRLAKDIQGHEVLTVPQAGWAGIKNGELLRLAQAQFDVFVTVDQNLSFQQNPPKIYHRRHCSSGADQSFERPASVDTPPPRPSNVCSQRPGNSGARKILIFSCIRSSRFLETGPRLCKGT